MTEVGTRLSTPQVPTRTEDLGALLGVVGVLLGVHLWLPDTLLSEFVFTYGEPNLVSVWTAATIHDSTAHLVSNLAWYAVVIGPAYTLYAICDRRRLFWLLYQRWGLVGPDSIAYGFSGVVSAFGGLLVVGLTGAIAARYSWPTSIATVVGFVASGLGIALSQTPLVAVPSIGMLFVAAVVAVGLGSFWWRLRERSVHQWVSAHQDAILLFAASGIVITALVAGIFSVETISGGRFPNVVAHGTGFVTGVSFAATGLSLA